MRTCAPPPDAQNKFFQSTGSTALALQVFACAVRSAGAYWRLLPVVPRAFVRTRHRPASGSCGANLKPPPLRLLQLYWRFSGRRTNSTSRTYGFGLNSAGLVLGVERNGNTYVLRRALAAGGGGRAAAADGGFCPPKTKQNRPPDHFSPAPDHFFVRRTIFRSPDHFPPAGTATRTPFYGILGRVLEG